MARRQSGFTLIELMIVVAIIGILAAIAIPQYQNYVARSQVTEAINLMGGIKTGVEEYVAQTGAFPDGSTTGQRAIDLGGNTSSAGAGSALGQYVKEIKFFSGTGGAGCIMATMNATEVSSGLESKVLTMYRNGAGRWAAGANGTTIPQQYLSTAFQGNTGEGTCS
ncbi:pilin [Halomonas sp. WWR20]